MCKFAVQMPSDCRQAGWHDIPVQQMKSSIDGRGVGQIRSRSELYCLKWSTCKQLTRPA